MLLARRRGEIRVRDWAFAFIIYFLLRLLMLTVRVREANVPLTLTETLAQQKPFLGAHWHGEEWLLLSTWRSRRMAVLSSLSREGTKMAAVLKLLGFHVCRGSSSLGGTPALRALKQALREGWNASLAVDGPRGPYHRTKPGVAHLAQTTGVRVFPVHGECSRAWQLKNWCATLIPKPFSTITLIYGPPIYPGASTAREEIERLRNAVQTSLELLPRA